MNKILNLFLQKEEGVHDTQDPSSTLLRQQSATLATGSIESAIHAADSIESPTPSRQVSRESEAFARELSVTAEFGLRL
jgi:hypothetical protein